MVTDKILDDFLPNKNSVYFRTFDKITEGKKINEQDIIVKIKKVFDDTDDKSILSL